MIFYFDFFFGCNLHGPKLHIRVLEEKCEAGIIDPEAVGNHDAPGLLSHIHEKGTILLDFF